MKHTNQIYTSPTAKMMADNKDPMDDVKI